MFNIQIVKITVNFQWIASTVNFAKAVLHHFRVYTCTLGFLMYSGVSNSRAGCVKGAGWSFTPKKLSKQDVIREQGGI